MKNDRQILGFSTSSSRPLGVGELSRRAEAGEVHGPDRRVLERVLTAMGSPPVGVELWDGEEVSTGNSNPVARIVIHDRSTLRGLLLRPDYQFGEAYSAGRLDVEGNLADCLEALYRASARAPSSWIRSLRRSLYRPRRNTLSGSRENISHHYDIGNDFYKLWLDEQLLYSCAYYPTPDATLEAAQIAKMDHICRKLQLVPGQSVLEVGCGWGALSLHMVRRYGVKVKAFNISREQIAYAQQRAQREGLSDRAEFIHDDYRAVSGVFDVFVSVGMLEHVGTEHYRHLGHLIRSSLKGSGLGLLHFIGRSRPVPLSPWIERRIFPGAHPPTLREFADVLEPEGFSVLDVENLRLHYARTLEQWLERFEGSAGRVRDMFDERFVRAWRLYLAGSIAAFRTGSLQLFQVLFTAPLNNDIPWTREYIYRASAHNSHSA
jgi:cyclopropane-fatty-acyl-phospholipid synthase